MCLGPSLRWDDELVPFHAFHAFTLSRFHQRSSSFNLSIFQSPTIFQSFNLHSHKPLYPTHAADEDVCKSTIHQRSYLFTLSPFHLFTFSSFHLSIPPPSFNPSISIPINLCTLRTRQTRASAITTNHEDVCHSIIHQRSYSFNLSIFPSFNPPHLSTFPPFHHSTFPPFHAFTLPRFPQISSLPIGAVEVLWKCSGSAVDIGKRCRDSHLPGQAASGGITCRAMICNYSDLIAIQPASSGAISSKPAF